MQPALPGQCDGGGVGLRHVDEDLLARNRRDEVVEYGAGGRGIVGDSSLARRVRRVTTMRGLPAPAPESVPAKIGLANGWVLR